MSTQRSELHISELMDQHPEEAFGLIYDLYARRLVSIAYRYVGDTEVAKDILQDAICKAYEGSDAFRYKGEGSLWGWLKAIVVNLSLNYLKSFNVRRMTRFEDNVASDEVVDDDNEVGYLNTIDSDTLFDLIAGLPEGYRAVINLYAIEGYSHKEIAQRLGIAERTSSSQYYRAKQELKRRIEKWIRERE